jgi:hypothetical protein
MKSDFLRELVDDVKEVEEQPTQAFKVGFAAGSILVSLGVFALEGILIASVATSLGWGLSFLQGLGVAALFELVMLRLKNG